MFRFRNICSFRDVKLDSFVKTKLKKSRTPTMAHGGKRVLLLDPAASVASGFPGATRKAYLTRWAGGAHNVAAPLLRDPCSPAHYALALLRHSEVMVALGVWAAVTALAYRSAGGLFSWKSFVVLVGLGAFAAGKRHAC